jgi:uncharacterized protein (DUF1778 family)
MDNGRRLTVALDDDVYVKLVDYAAQMSKQNMGRFSLSAAMRELVAKALNENKPAAPGGHIEPKRAGLGK